MRRWAASAAAARNNTRPSPPRSEQCPASRGSPTTGEPLFAAERPGAGRGPTTGEPERPGAGRGRARRPREAAAGLHRLHPVRRGRQSTPAPSRFASPITRHPSPVTHRTPARCTLRAHQLSPLASYHVPAQPRRAARWRSAGLWGLARREILRRWARWAQEEEEREPRGLRAQGACLCEARLVLGDQLHEKFGLKRDRKPAAPPAQRRAPPRARLSSCAAARLERGRGKMKPHP